MITGITVTCSHCGKVSEIKSLSDTPCGWTNITTDSPLKSDAGRVALIGKTKTETSVCQACGVLLDHWLTPPEAEERTQ